MNPDKHMSQEEVGKLCNNMEEENRALTKAVESQSRKLVNIQAYFDETKRQMADNLQKITTQRDNAKTELKQLQEQNHRFRDELVACERRSRDRVHLEVISDSDLEEVERIVQTVSKELESLELKDKRELKTNLTAITTATKMIDKINKEYKSELLNQRKELNMAVETKASQEAKIREIQKEIEMMQVDVKREKAELNEKEVEISCLKDSIEGIDKQVQVVQAKRDEHKRKLIQIVKDFKSARMEYKMVMKERQTEIDYVKKQITDFQADTKAQILPNTKKPGLFKKRFGWLYRRH